jgi:hypothetical protein
MKKYFFEAQKKQLEKPTEPLYVSCSKAKCIVYAENDAEAALKAEKKLAAEFYGTGIALGKPVLTKTAELPVDWSYGYDDARKSGATETLGDLVGTGNVIR